MKIVILGTVPNDLLNFRSDLIKDILKKNYKVIASSSSLDNDSKIHMKNLGVTYQPIYLNRHGLNLIGDVRTLMNLYSLYRKHCK